MPGLGSPLCLSQLSALSGHIHSDGIYISYHLLMREDGFYCCCLLLPSNPGLCTVLGIQIHPALHLWPCPRWHIDMGH